MGMKQILPSKQSDMFKQKSQQYKIYNLHIIAVKSAATLLHRLFDFAFDGANLSRRLFIFALKQRGMHGARAILQFGATVATRLLFGRLLLS
jgi:hypothetical protein